MTSMTAVTVSRLTVTMLSPSGLTYKTSTRIVSRCRYIRPACTAPTPWGRWTGEGIV